MLELELTKYMDLVADSIQGRYEQLDHCSSFQYPLDSVAIIIIRYKYNHECA